MQELSFYPKADEEIVLSLAADVTGAWLTSSASIVEKLQDFHVLGHDFLEKCMSLPLLVPLLRMASLHHCQCVQS